LGKKGNQFEYLKQTSKRCDPGEVFNQGALPSGKEKKKNSKSGATQSKVSRTKASYIDLPQKGRGAKARKNGKTLSKGQELLPLS